MGICYVPDSEWRLIFDHGLLVLSAGADRLYAMEDVAEETANELIERWDQEQLDAAELSPPALELLSRLVDVGLLRRSSVDELPQRIGVRWAGEPDHDLGNRLRDFLAGSDFLEPSVDAIDVVLVVRTTARLVELYRSPEAIPVPHLLLDVAYHHTISIGPLVFTGETACLACLAGRVNHLWGDPEPPARPSALRAAPLAAALAVLELEKVAGGDYGLANATVAYDLESRRLVAGAVYRLPWCPVCGDGGESAGMVDLPWTNAA